MQTKYTEPETVGLDEIAMIDSNVPNKLKSSEPVYPQFKVELHGDMNVYHFTSEGNRRIQEGIPFGQLEQSRDYTVTKVPLTDYEKSFNEGVIYREWRPIDHDE